MKNKNKQKTNKQKKKQTNKKQQKKQQQKKTKNKQTNKKKKKKKKNTIGILFIIRTCKQIFRSYYFSLDHKDTCTYSWMLEIKDRNKFHHVSNKICHSYCHWAKMCLVLVPVRSIDFSFSRKNENIWATSWENLFMSYANNKDADQPAHPHNLTSVFNVRCLDSIISLLHLSEISSL